jgi:hypothetical protein
MKQTATLRKFRYTPSDIADYRACIQRGEGFIANCCSGYPQGYKFHSASCRFLDAHKNRNPIRGTTGKIWAATLKELAANEAHGRQHAPGLYGCRCLQTEAPEEYGADMERESHLVVPGGQIESNRRRH